MFFSDVGSTANKLDIMVTRNEYGIEASLFAIASNSAANIRIQAGIGLDSTTAIATGSMSGIAHSPGADYLVTVPATLRTFPGVGRHTVVWLEKSPTATTTWIGASAGDLEQSCIHGMVQG